MPLCEPSLKKLGYVIEEENDSILMWNGERCEPEETPVIETYEDHRMAMAFAPAIIRYPNLLIADPQVVTKSYPGYWEDLKQAGFQVINEANFHTLWKISTNILPTSTTPLL